ncbi:MAG: hypothetical protein ABFS39_04205 [Pseudomonadota bacterium]
MQPEAVTLFEGDFLGQALDLGNFYLQKGCEGEIIEPIEACEKLYVVADGKVVAVINDYSNLSAYVEKVDSAAQAESFVRLLTSLETFHLFDRDRIEIDCRFVDRDQEPIYAQIARDDADRLGLHPVGIIQSDTGYQIKRCLYVWASRSDHPQLHEVTEIVGSGGSYTRIADRLVTDEDTRIITLPVYE